MLDTVIIINNKNAIKDINKLGHSRYKICEPHTLDRSNVDRHARNDAVHRIYFNRITKAVLFYDVLF
jgi:Leucine-rich repeat (LRR) protein